MGKGGLRVRQGLTLASPRATGTTAPGDKGLVLSSAPPPVLQTAVHAVGVEGEELRLPQSRMWLGNTRTTHRFHPEDRYSTGPRPATFRNSSTP